jgi:hypothetical protein
MARLAKWNGSPVHPKGAKRRGKPPSFLKIITDAVPKYVENKRGRRRARGGLPYPSQLEGGDRDVRMLASQGKRSSSSRAGGEKGAEKVLTASISGIYSNQNCTRSRTSGRYRNAARTGTDPGTSAGHIGFRVVRDKT